MELHDLRGHINLTRKYKIPIHILLVFRFFEQVLSCIKSCKIKGLQLTSALLDWNLIGNGFKWEKNCLQRIRVQIVSNIFSLLILQELENAKKYQQEIPSEQEYVKTYLASSS